MRARWGDFDVWEGQGERKRWRKIRATAKRRAIGRWVMGVFRSVKRIDSIMGTPF